MKKQIIISTIGYTIICLLCFSCSDDFLKENKIIKNSLTEHISMTSLDENTEVNFDFPEGKNSEWKIVQSPRWVRIEPREGQFVNGKSTFQIQIIEKYSLDQLGANDLALVFNVEGYGLVQYPFSFFNYGFPRATLSTNDLPLYYQSAGSFSIRNIENGILQWKIKEVPSWASISKSEGLLYPNENETLTVTVSRDNMTKGDYTGNVGIVTNSVYPNLTLNLSMKVTDPTLPGIMGRFEGDVVDADYCKNSGLMVVATKNPNQICFFKPEKQMSVLTLNKIPICVTISEDGSRIAAGFTNTELSLIDPNRETIIKSIATGIIPSDVALGENGWAYLSPKQYQSEYLISVNIETEEIVKNKTSVNGISLLKKVPGKNLLYGSKVGWSPDFLLVYDISQGAANDKIDEWRMDLEKFWFFEDGNRFFTGIRKIYKSPVYLQKNDYFDKPVLAGEIEEVSGSIYSADHSAVLHELFVAYKSYSYETGAKVLRIDDSGFYVKKSFKVTDCLIDENGTILTLTPEVPFIFVNKSGTELYLIKKVTNYSSKVYWFFDKVKL